MLYYTEYFLTIYFYDVIVIKKNIDALYKNAFASNSYTQLIKRQLKILLLIST